MEKKQTIKAIKEERKALCDAHTQLTELMENHQLKNGSSTMIRDFHEKKIWDIEKEIVRNAKLLVNNENKSNKIVRKEVI